MTKNMDFKILKSEKLKNYGFSVFSTAKIYVMFIAQLSWQILCAYVNISFLKCFFVMNTSPGLFFKRPFTYNKYVFKRSHKKSQNGKFFFILSPNGTKIPRLSVILFVVIQFVVCSYHKLVVQ